MCNPLDHTADDTIESDFGKCITYKIFSFGNNGGYFGDCLFNAPLRSYSANSITIALDGQCIGADIRSDVAGDCIILCGQQQSIKVYCECLRLFFAIIGKRIAKLDNCTGNILRENVKRCCYFSIKHSNARNGNRSCTYIHIILINNSVVGIRNQTIISAKNLEFRFQCVTTAIITVCNRLNHILCQRAGNRSKCKDFSTAVAEIVDIGYIRRRVGNSQGIALNSRIGPFGSLCHIKALRQLAEIKCTADQVDGIAVGETIQIGQCRILAHIKTRKLVVAAVQIGQSSIIAYIKAG